MTNAKLTFICCLLIYLAACSNNLLNIAKESDNKFQKFIIPQGYVGWVRISYEVPDASPLPIEDGNLMYRIPDTGFLETSSKKKEDVLGSAKFFYNTENKLTEIKPSFWDGGGMILGSLHRSSNQA
ncbi:MAG: hypothetical protein LC768_15170 [Acidobacteria bacterium]|nr:hypothetical protein [Acidobacteriota bacterium]MCA1639646.1 hypothetical protein [Acidobacteriota bacterium]